MADHSPSVNRSLLFGWNRGGCTVCGSAIPTNLRKYCSPYCRNVADAVTKLYSWGYIRERVKERDGHQCVRCGSTDHLSVDHIIPRSKDGHPFSPTNLQTLCRECNSSKGTNIADYRGYGDDGTDYTGELMSVRLLERELPDWFVGDPPEPVEAVRDGGTS